MTQIDPPEYTEGICGDGAAILKDGFPMTISEILQQLNALNLMRQLDGMVMVPVEPTGAMIVDGIKAHLVGSPNLKDPEYIKNIYKSMISAARPRED